MQALGGEYPSFNPRNVILQLVPAGQGKNILSSAPSLSYSIFS